MAVSSISGCFPPDHTTPDLLEEREEAAAEQGAYVPEIVCLAANFRSHDAVFSSFSTISGCFSPDHATPDLLEEREEAAAEQGVDAAEIVQLAAAQRLHQAVHREHDYK